MRSVSMSQILSLTIVGFVLPSIAYTSDYPTRGIVYAKSQAASITYSCTRVDAELHCEMNQLLISRKVKPDEVEKNRQQLNEMAMDLVKDKKSLAECQKMTSEFRKVMSDLKAPKHSLSEERRAQLEEIPLKAREELQTLGRLLIDYCTKPTRANREAFVQHQLEERRKTCTALVNHWTEVFVRPQGLTSGNAAAVETWVTKSAPSGPCGVISVNRWQVGEGENSQNYGFYDYIARKVVTNPSGQTLLGTSCQALDEATYTYTWQPRDVPFDCTNLKLSPF